MALDKQILPLSLGIGVDTKTDPKQVIATKLLSLENTVLGTGGEFRKRNGYNSLNSVSAGNAIASFQDQLVALDGNSLNSYSSSQDQFNSVGNCVAVDIQSKSIAKRSGNYHYPEMAYNSGIYGSIYSAVNTQTFISVTDSVTGQDIIRDQLLSKIAYLGIVKATALGTKIIFSYATAAGELGYYYIEAATPQTLLGPFVLKNDFNFLKQGFDCKVINGSLVYAYTDFSSQTSLFSLSPTLVQSATYQVNVYSFTLGIFEDALNNVWVANTVGTIGGAFTVNYFVVDPTLTATVLANTNIQSFGAGIVDWCGGISGVVVAGVGNIFYTIAQPGFSATNPKPQYTRKAQYDVSGAQIAAPSDLVRSAGLYSKPFIKDSVIYMAITYYSSLQSTYFLINSSGQVVSKFAPGVAGSDQLFLLRDVTELGLEQFTLPYTESNAFVTTNGFTINQLGVSQLFFNFNDPMVTEKIGNNLQISGGIVSMFDGANVVEQGFNIFPEGLLVTGTGAGSIGVGTYQYVATYEWTDDQGQTHKSAPSDALSVIVAAPNSSVTISVPTLRITQKQNVLIVVYRTLANQNQFYQVSPTPALGSPILNSTTTDSISFTDTIGDASAINNIQLYTNGGEIENTAPPAMSSIFQYQNRLMGVYSENPTQVGYSKIVIPGSPVEFTQEFVINLPEKDDGVIVGAQMDDKCIFFKSNSIYYMAGQGPSANGQNNDFTIPIQISADAGCINKKSVVLTPRGLMFQSSKGIYLLERSMQVNYIGAAVEQYNDQLVTSAEMIESVNQIRFTLDSGICLVYDYYYDQWATFTNISAVDSTVFQNVYTYIRGDGEVFQEAIGTYTDDGAPIYISFTTAWFSFNKLQGFQRAYKMLILGEYFSPHTLQVDFSVDFNPAVVQTVTIPVNSSITPYQLRVFLTNQKCQSYQLTISESQTAPYGEGLSISVLSFEVGGKKGTNKIPAGYSYG